MKEEHYSPAEINFKSKEQVLWLIRNLSLISSGVWPSDHKETGYAGSSKKVVGHRAPYEAAEVIAGELELRLEKCGDDGLALEFVVCLSDSDDIYLKQRIANYQRRSYDEVCQGISTALKYIRGYHRKKISYGRFCYLRRNGNKKGQPLRLTP